MNSEGINSLAIHVYDQIYKTAKLNFAMIFETTRLLLREITTKDAEFIYILNSDPDVLRYTGDLKFESVEEALTFIENYSDYKTNDFGRWLVINKGSNQPIGWCGLKLNEENDIDLGFRFLKEYWGKGYATEAAMGCIRYGFNELDISTIIGRAMPENKASIRVLEKAGMKFYKQGICHGIHVAVYYKIDRYDLFS